MGLRFWRRVRIAPGVTLNLSKTGGSVSLGPRGAKYTVGPRGRRATVGIPGTGLFYTATRSGAGQSGGGRTSARAAGEAAGFQERIPPKLGFFKRLLTPAAEQAFIEACRQLAMGNDDEAATLLRQAEGFADGAFLSGFVAIKQKRFDDAVRVLLLACNKSDKLGASFHKHGILVLFQFAVIEEMLVTIRPDQRGVLLCLVESFQQKGEWSKAKDTLVDMRISYPDDPEVKLSHAETLLRQPTAGGEPESDRYHEILRITDGIDNDSAVNAALLLYKARALRGLGLATAARDVLTTAIRRTKDRPEELLKAIRYERAEVYAELGRNAQSRGEFEKLYAADPAYRDVSARLGL